MLPVLADAQRSQCAWPQATASAHAYLGASAAHLQRIRRGPGIAPPTAQRQGEGGNLSRHQPVQVPYTESHIRAHACRGILHCLLPWHGAAWSSLLRARCAGAAMLELLPGGYVDGLPKCSPSRQTPLEMRLACQHEPRRHDGRRAQRRDAMHRDKECKPRRGRRTRGAAGSPGRHHPGTLQTRGAWSRP